MSYYQVSKMPFLRHRCWHNLNWPEFSAYREEWWERTHSLTKPWQASSQYLRSVKASSVITRHLELELLFRVKRSNCLPNLPYLNKNTSQNILNTVCAYNCSYGTQALGGRGFSSLLLQWSCKKIKWGKKILPNIQPYPELLKPIKVSGLLIFRGDKKIQESLN